MRKFRSNKAIYGIPYLEALTLITILSPSLEALYTKLNWKRIRLHQHLLAIQPKESFTLLALKVLQEIPYIWPQSNLKERLAEESIMQYSLYLFGLLYKIFFRKVLAIEKKTCNLVDFLGKLVHSILQITIYQISDFKWGSNIFYSHFCKLIQRLLFPPSLIRLYLLTPTSTPLDATGRISPLLTQYL